MTDDIPSTPSSPDGGATANELLREVRLFVSGATNTSNVNVSQTDLVKSAIFLLRSLPAAREAVLEHLYNVFDDFVGTFVSKLEKSKDGGRVDLPSSSMYLLDEINSLLTNFIISNPEAWAPIIFNWSLDLLGRLSSKYGDRLEIRIKDKSATLSSSDYLNNILEGWMKCQAAKTLISLSTQCLSTQMNSNVDICIDALLDMSVQHSPYFDWFIAHIGSCFPNTIISRVLACGLKDFCSTSLQQNVHGKKVPKIASVVEILGHLSSRYSKQIKQSLLSLANESLNVDCPSRMQIAILPYLLQLSSKCPLLLSSIMSEIITICLNDEAMKKLLALANQWKTTGLIQSLDSMVPAVVELILQSSDRGSHLLTFLLDTSVSNEDLPLEVKNSCGIILDSLLVELQPCVFSNSMDIPIFSSIANDLSFVSKHVVGPQSSLKSRWISQLLSYFCIYCDKNISIQVLTIVLTKCTDLKILSKIIQYLEPLYPDILILSVDYAFTNLSRKDLNLLLVNIIALIKQGDGKKQLNSGLIPHLSTLSKYLNCMEDDVSINILKLLSLISITENTSISLLSELCQEIVIYFFKQLTSEIEDQEKTDFVVKNCQNLLVSMSRNQSMLFLILRLLVKGSLSEAHCKWFGNTTPKIVKKDQKSYHIMEENLKYSNGIAVPQSHLAVLYAGMIGNGIRVIEQGPSLCEFRIKRNRSYLIATIQNCCTPDDEIFPSIGAMSKLSLLMVELISPDVMFNGLPWPDGDFLKVTMERDIAINKSLEENPILWDILYVVARTKPCLCYSSVLLRGVAATLIFFWSSSQEKASSNCKKHLDSTKKLISLMSLGELIPPPLSQIGEILEHLTPFEMYVVLSDVWKYMNDNVPTPDSFIKSEQGFKIHKNLGCRAPEKYTMRLRHIMQAKLHKLGAIYPKLFTAIE